MTLAELKQFIATENRIQVIWITPENRHLSHATILLAVPFPKGTPGRYQSVDCVMLDEEYKPDTLLGVYFHELGHRDYCCCLARKDWNEIDAEVHAHRFALSELMRCDFREQLQRYMRNVDHWTASIDPAAAGDAEVKRLHEIVDRFKASDEWETALNFGHQEG